jgi:NAD(P)H dehydrogenase (quinone)
VHAPARIGREARVAELARYRARILGLASAPTISYPVLDDYDQNYVLKKKSR